MSFSKFKSVGLLKRYKGSPFGQKWKKKRKQETNNWNKVFLTKFVKKKIKT